MIKILALGFCIGISVALLGLFILSGLFVSFLKDKEREAEGE